MAHVLEESRDLCCLIIQSTLPHSNLYLLHILMQRNQEWGVQRIAGLGNIPDGPRIQSRMLADADVGNAIIMKAWVDTGFFYHKKSVWRKLYFSGLFSLKEQDVLSYCWEYRWKDKCIKSVETLSFMIFLPECCDVALKSSFLFSIFSQWWN
jgi:hypothetical protein